MFAKTGMRNVGIWKIVGRRTHGGLPVCGRHGTCEFPAYYRHPEFDAQASGGIADSVSDIGRMYKCGIKTCLLKMKLA